MRYEKETRACAAAAAADEASLRFGTTQRPPLRHRAACATSEKLVRTGLRWLPVSDSVAASIKSPGVRSGHPLHRSHPARAPAGTTSSYTAHTHTHGTLFIRADCSIADGTFSDLHTQRVTAFFVLVYSFFL